MLDKKIKLLAQSTVLLLVFLILSTHAFAQTVSLSITPPIIEVAIKPGKSVLIAYTVSNLGDPSIVSSEVLPFSAGGHNGELVIEDEFSGPIRFNLENSNIALGDPFFLNSREGQQLLLKIRVPEGTPQGDYYYTFLAKNEPGKLAEGRSAAQATARVGSNILLTVTNDGNVDVDGKIGSLTVDPRFSLNLLGKKYNIFESTDIIPVHLILQNHGNNLIKPQGTITLRGNFGERAEFAILPQNILKTSSRTAIATPSAEIQKTLDDNASLHLEGFFVGKYTLLADVHFGQDEQNQTTQTEFYAFPFKLILATVFALAVGIAVAKKIGREE